MTRTILHVDMDAFFAAVEQRDRPELRGKPVVIGSGPNERGVVATASYEAREFGIHSAMPSREAGRRCPHAVFLTPDGKKYQAVSGQVFEIFERFTPAIEKLSIDEAFLDVSGALRILGDGPRIAQAIRSAIREELNLTASVGVAPNKFLAKLASDLKKPDGVTVVPTESSEILSFLAPLPVGRIWGVGTVMQGKLEGAGIRTIGDLQARSKRELSQYVGAHSAEHLQRLSRGEDVREVSESPRAEKSISREHTFSVDCNSGEQVRRVLGDLVEDVGRRLRRDGRHAHVAHLKLRWKGFKTLTRQRQFDRPASDDMTLRRVAEGLLAQIPLENPVRLIGFGVSDLRAELNDQLSLFDEPAEQADRRAALSRSVDQIRDTFGKQSIRRASSANEKRNADQDGNQ